MQQIEHRIGHVESIPPGEGRTIVLDGTRIAVFRSRADRLYATQAECPHRGGPLADGLVADKTIVCPLHEYRFDLRNGAFAGKNCKDLKVYPIRIDEAGEMHVSVDRAS